MNPINMRFKKIRESLKISQKELGNALGLSNSGISNIENGIRSVTEKHIKLLSATFHINEEWLRTGDGDMLNQGDDEKINEIAKRHNLTPLQADIIKTVLRYPEAQRDPLVNFIVAIADTVRENNMEMATEIVPDIAFPGKYVPVSSDEEIEAEVEGYRQELEDEKRAAERSGASPGSKNA